MRWIIAGVKCSFQPRQVDRAWPTSHPLGGGSLRWWRCEREARLAWCIARWGFCTAVDSTGGLWEGAYQCVSGSISICHVYSSGVLAACWLLCQDSLISFSWELTWSANRNPPTARNPHQTPTITALTPTHTHTSFWQSLLVIFSSSWSFTPLLTSPPLCSPGWRGYGLNYCLTAMQCTALKLPSWGCFLQCTTQVTINVMCFHTRIIDMCTDGEHGKYLKLKRRVWTTALRVAAK